MLSASNLDTLRTANRTVRVSVSSVVVRLALMHVVETAAWQSCRHTGTCTCLRVSDELEPSDGMAVMVVRDAPAECQQAVDAVLEGRARAVMLWDDPESLLAIFEAVRHHSTLIPNRVIDLASRAPRLSARQRDTLRLVAMGRSNRAISSTLTQSVSTTKRDIAELLQLFDAPNRVALMSSAGSLGFISRTNCFTVAPG